VLLSHKGLRIKCHFEEYIRLAQYKLRDEESRGEARHCAYKTHHAETLRYPFGFAQGRAQGDTNWYF